MLALWLNSGIHANKTMYLGRITGSSNIPQLYSLGSSVSVASWCEFGLGDSHPLTNLLGGPMVFLPLDS